MAQIEIELNDQDIALLVREGQLHIPLGEGIIDANPQIALKYAEDKPEDLLGGDEE